MKDKHRPGAEAIASKGWLGAHRYLLLRRFSQISILLLFVAGPWWGLWLLSGNLSASLIAHSIPLTEPLVFAQSLFAGFWPAASAWLGVALVIGFYLLVGGRVYCAWVCPMNIITDAAAWLRNRLDIKPAVRLERHLRFWMLALVLILAALTHSLLWELINPVSLLQRGLLFGMGMGWISIIALFCFDLFVARHGWCGHLCPLGASYSLFGQLSPLRVTTPQRAACNDCLDCFRICPEPQVITSALKDLNHAPRIDSSQCTRCGRCIDVCSKDVFRFRLSTPTAIAIKSEENP